MKKYSIIILLTIAISSCISYSDCGKSIYSSHFDLIYLNNYNEFIYKSKVDGVADHDIYITTNFSINLPKKIKSWTFSGNEYFFEYSGREIIYINSGYINIGDIKNWAVRETNKDEIYNRIGYYYWGKRGYSENSLAVRRSGRVSKVYTDGKVLIILYNIKKENFEKYFDFVKSFKYLNLPPR